MAHIWRDVVMLGRGADKHPLHLRLRGTPERKPPVTVMVVHVHDECPLAADEERRRAWLGRSLVSGKERQTFRIRAIRLWREVPFTRVNEKRGSSPRRARRPGRGGGGRYRCSRTRAVAPGRCTPGCRRL